jgi:hypothetical protein
MYSLENMQKKLISIFNKEEENNEENNNNNEEEETDSNEDKNTKLTEKIKNENDEGEEEAIENNNQNDKINEPFMQAFKSWRFHLFNFMSVGTLCKFYFLF